MLLMEPNQTPYDLRFRLFGIPVRVHPLFWLVAALLGWQTTDRGGAPSEGVFYLLIWIVCLFVSILIHELGHVWMGMIFGSRGHIVIYGFGGLAIGSNSMSTWWKRVLVSFAGPLAGFLFLAAILLGFTLASPAHGLFFVNQIIGYFGLPPIFSIEFIANVAERPVSQFLLAALSFLIFVNLFWGLINLLPIWPLDGGQISRDSLTRFFPGNGYRASLMISFTIAALLALNAVLEMRDMRFIPFAPGGLFIAIFFALFAVQSFQLIQQQTHDPWDPWQGQDRPWERRR